jgi:hypothetical protein
MTVRGRNSRTCLSTGSTTRLAAAVLESKSFLTLDLSRGIGGGEDFPRYYGYIGDTQFVLRQGRERELHGSQFSCKVTLERKFQLLLHENRVVFRSCHLDEFSVMQWVVERPVSGGCRT